MPRIRTIIGLLLVGTLIWVASPARLMATYAQRHLISAFAAMGYMHPRYDITDLTWTHLRIENIQLEPDAISTIDAIDMTYTPWRILWSGLDSITITHPDIIFSVDSPLPLNIQGLFSFFDLKSINTRSLRIEDLALSYAGDNINPSLTGNFDLRPDSNGLPVALFQLSGAQKDLTLTLKGTAQTLSDGLTKIELSLPEARIELPDMMMARGNGQFSLLLDKNNHITQASGKFGSGGMRIGRLKLNDIRSTLANEGDKISFMADADMTGMPMAHASLRMNARADKFQTLMQLSAQSPKDIAAALFSKVTVPLASQEKFALMYMWEGKDFLDMMTHLSSGNLFFYGAGAKPLAQLSVSCPRFDETCRLTLPPSFIQTADMTQFAGAILADQGISLTSGDIKLKAVLTPFHPDHFLSYLGADFDHVDLTFKNIVFHDAQGSGEWTFDGLSMTSFSGKALGGTIALSPFDTTGRDLTPLILTGQNLDLSEVTTFLGIKGLTLTGKGRAQIPFLYQGNTVRFRNPMTLAAENGTLSYEPSVYPDYLSGASPRRVALRAALMNYAYKTFDLRLMDAEKETVKGILSLRGRAPDLYGDQEVDIDITGTGPMLSNLRSLLP